MNLSSFIDHTILRPDATKEQIIKVCREAKNYKFASVCVNPYNIELVKEQLKGTDIKCCTVVGFPLGATIKEVKVFETEQAIKAGAEEIDMVINIGAVKNKNYDYVEDEISQIVDVCHKNNACVKVIIETCLLTDEEKKKVCEIVAKLKADFVKTSTGFSNAGAKVEDIRLMKKIVGYDVKVKASGGIKNYSKAKEMIDNGADRLGTSSSIFIINGED